MKKIIEPHIQARECAKAAAEARQLAAAVAPSDALMMEFYFEAARKALASCGLVKTQNATSEARRLKGDYILAAHELERVTQYVEQCAHHLHEIAARMALAAGTG